MILRCFSGCPRRSSVRHGEKGEREREEEDHGGKNLRHGNGVWWSGLRPPGGVKKSDGDRCTPPLWVGLARPPSYVELSWPRLSHIFSDFLSGPDRFGRYAASKHQRYGIGMVPRSAVLLLPSIRDLLHVLRGLLLTPLTDRCDPPYRVPISAHELLGGV
jgi:hypothetical protein